MSFARDAHSLYIESLAELGPLGLALVLASLSVPLLALRRRATPLVATAAGAYVTALLHTGIDWDWELPAVAVVGLLCGSAVLVGSREEGAVLGLRSRLGLLALAVGFAVFALVRVKTGTKLPFGP